MILTTASMLRAAERKLADHRRTRPATTTEAAAIAASLRSEHATSAAALRAQHAPMRGFDTAREDIRRAAALGRVNVDLAAAEHRTEIHAQAWDRVADLPEGEAWRETERALVERVEYYRELLKREIGRAS